LTKFSGNKIYIRIDVNPLSASAVTVKLIGPSDEIEPLRKKYNEKMTDWDIDLDIYKNLLRIFELLYFPMPSDEETNQVRCSICYMYRLENQIPIISCDNEQCDLVFHVVCLREWFATLTDSKTFLKITMGSCPFCKAVNK
jgi:E3 ubiquitin-protein ligase FANCL